MPLTEVRAFRDERGRIPLQDWLLELEQKDPGAHHKCIALILELAERGNELRRPTSDALRNGIRELRTHEGTVQYRILYFFYGKGLACCSHGVIKEKRVKGKDIDDAVKAKKLVARNAAQHAVTFRLQR